VDSHAAIADVRRVSQPADETLDTNSPQPFPPSRLLPFNEYRLRPATLAGEPRRAMQSLIAVGQHEATMGWLALFKRSRAVAMTINIVAIQPLVALIAGILILLIPRILNFVVAIYLILIGVLGLWPHLIH
jgi:hypothetical protein